VAIEARSIRAVERVSLYVECDAFEHWSGFAVLVPCHGDGWFDPSACILIGQPGPCARVGVRLLSKVERTVRMHDAHALVAMAVGANAAPLAQQVGTTDELSSRQDLGCARVHAVRPVVSETRLVRLVALAVSSRCGAQYDRSGTRPQDATRPYCLRRRCCARRVHPERLACERSKSVAAFACSRAALGSTLHAAGGRQNERWGEGDVSCAQRRGTSRDMSSCRGSRVGRGRSACEHPAAREESRADDEECQ
jgi:hypothetical protein